MPSHPQGFISRQRSLFDDRRTLPNVGQGLASRRTTEWIALVMLALRHHLPSPCGGARGVLASPSPQGLLASMPCAPQPGVRQAPWEVRQTSDCRTANRSAPRRRPPISSNFGIADPDPTAHSRLAASVAAIIAYDAGNAGKFGEFLRGNVEALRGGAGIQTGAGRFLQ